MTISPEQSNDDLMKHLQLRAAQLSEHFDSVQIFTTKKNSTEGTTAFNFGEGNWYSRYGQVREWVVKSEERFRIDEKNP